MADDARDAEIARHIESISTRADEDTLRLMSAIAGRSWPAGADDRCEPAALAWVRNWGPRRSGAPVPACVCSVGRCGVCN
jgi:hypothetical protein